MTILSNVFRALFISFILVSCSNDNLIELKDEPRAILIEGSGSYSREISTNRPASQIFFDQGLRFAWGFYFPESIASYQEASRLDPNHPMPYWGMAHAMGPNPNSRYARMPDDPKGEGLKAIKEALESTPPELSADLVDMGLVLTGGGALLKNIDKRFSKETGLPVHVADDPLSCVAVGTGKALDQEETFSTMLSEY